MRFLIALVLAISSVASKTHADNPSFSIAQSLFWKTSIGVGPNGPIPAIVVDQFGYPLSLAKYAVLRDPKAGYDSSASYNPGSVLMLVDLDKRKIVKKASIDQWNSGQVHDASGDRAWWFNFSDVEIPGRYSIVDPVNQIRSPEFSIDANPYLEVLKHATRVFYYQRAGYPKISRFAGKAWADRASHLGRGQDPETRPWPSTEAALTRINENSIRDLRGGWYDAGDYSKYTNFAARNIIVLLRAYDENPQSFADNNNIPESGNGVPDLLDEIKWGLDWLVRMQTESGSVLCVQGLDSASPPSAARGRSHYGPPTTSATLMAAAAFAYASRVFSGRNEASLRKYAHDLKDRAIKAWQWAERNPTAKYYNNDESRQPGSGGLAAGQQELSKEERRRAKIETAIYLYELTGESGFRDFVEESRKSLAIFTKWDVDIQEALLYYARLPAVSPRVRSEILRPFLGKMRGVIDSFEAILRKSDPYRSWMTDYTWGSNKTKTMQARLFQLVARYGDDDDIKRRAREAALGYLHYVHGVNPVGLVFLTNMGLVGAEHSAITMYHDWFSDGTPWDAVGNDALGPPPGFLVGGPNPGFSLAGCCGSSRTNFGFLCGSWAADTVCRRSYVPPIGQPVLKSFLQFNDDWPANSWEVTEPSTGYQAYYIRLLADFVE